MSEQEDMQRLIANMSALVARQTWPSPSSASSLAGPETSTPPDTRRPSSPATTSPNTRARTWRSVSLPERKGNVARAADNSTITLPPTRTPTQRL